MILVTGGTGLLGAYLLLELTRNGEKIRALRREHSSMLEVENIFRYNDRRAEALLKQIEWVNGDICDIFSLEDAMEGIEYVYHCAAMVSFNPKDRAQMMRVNIEGTANVVNASLTKGIKKLCHVSSIAALGRAEEEKMVTEETAWKSTKQNSNYAISKYGGEFFLQVCAVLNLIYNSGCFPRIS